MDIKILQLMSSETFTFSPNHGNSASYVMVPSNTLIKFMLTSKKHVTSLDMYVYEYHF